MCSFRLLLTEFPQPLTLRGLRKGFWYVQHKENIASHIEFGSAPRKILLVSLIFSEVWGFLETLWIIFILLYVRLAFLFISLA